MSDRDDHLVCCDNTTFAGRGRWANILIERFHSGEVSSPLAGPVAILPENQPRNELLRRIVANGQIGQCDAARVREHRDVPVLYVAG